MLLTVADPSLVLLVGPSGSGKTTFAMRAFPGSAILSSDELRRMLTDDANDQGASAQAFQLLGLLLGGRLSRRLLTVVDATNIRADSRRRWLAQARRWGVPAAAIVFDLSLAECLALNAARPGRRVADEVVRDQHARFAAARDGLAAEGYAAVHVLHGSAGVAAAQVELVR